MKELMLYRKLIYELQDYLDCDPAVFIREHVASYGVGDRIEVNFLYNEYAGTVAIASFAPVPRSVEPQDWYFQLLNANTGYAGIPTSRIGLTDDAQHLVLSTELPLAGLTAAILARVTLHLISATEYWAEPDHPRPRIPVH